MKLVEECAGIGTVRWQDRRFPRIPYRINRFQGFAASGLPVPGFHRIEGVIEAAELEDAAKLVGQSFTLDLEDGRSLALTLTDASGRVLAEGHGPTRGCSCC